MIIDTDASLKHFGTKGMKWGVRKQKRLERKIAKNQNKDWFKRAEAAVAESVRNPDSVILTRAGVDQPKIMITGAAFATHLSNGGTFDMRITQIITPTPENTKWAHDVNQRWSNLRDRTS